MEFFLVGSCVCLAHCPIQGPQALAKTTPPIFSKEDKIPSRSAVYRTNSEPGVTVNSDLLLSSCFNACLAIDSARVKSS